jgi:hypothetical protein
MTVTSTKARWLDPILTDGTEEARAHVLPTGPDDYVIVIDLGDGYMITLRCPDDEQMRDIELHYGNGSHVASEFAIEPDHLRDFAKGAFGLKPLTDEELEAMARDV